MARALASRVSIIQAITVQPCYATRDAISARTLHFASHTPYSIWVSGSGSGTTVQVFARCAETPCAQLVTGAVRNPARPHSAISFCPPKNTGRAPGCVNYRNGECNPAQQNFSRKIMTRMFTTPEIESESRRDVLPTLLPPVERR
jgi:hypothetical protein